MLHKPFSPVLAVGTFAIVLTLVGCGPPVDLRGNDPDKSAMAAIRPGVTDKASVTKLLGSPSSVATFDPNTWYYISEQTQDIAFFKPALRDEKVVTISFDNKGVVQRVAYLGMKQHEDVEPNPDATPAPGREFSVLEQLIGNFGRFSSPQGGGEGGGPNPNTGNH
jgi:outer membrane protein assembly factor BamE (lipoprotein component of BamABCDE complex)